MKKIIVPIDFSKHSEYAIEMASILAKKYKAEILALHMLEISETVLTQTSSRVNEKAAYFLRLAEQKFEEFLDKDYLKGVNVIPVIKHYKVFSEVSDIAHDHSVDLIVMGSHGVSGLSEVFVGSNTEIVVRHSDIPVLVVKQKPKASSFKNVLFACNFSKECIEPYKRASKLFKILDANMQLVYINTPAEEFRSSIEMGQNVSEFLKEADGNLNRLEDVHYFSDYTIEKGILNYSNLINADLIAVPTHGRRGLAHFFEGSISEDLANHAKRPVITFKI